MPPLDGNLKGWLLKLAEINRYPNASWILEMANLRANTFSLECSFLSSSSTDFSTLSELTGVDVKILESLTYEQTEPGMLSLFGSAIPRYYIRFATPKICPSCLREAAYTRKLWDLGPVTACPHHSALLLDECPGCKKRISWARPAVCVCSCNYDWRNSEPVKVGDHEIALSRRIYELCGLIKRSEKMEEAKFKNPLFSLDLKRLIQAVIFVAGQYIGDTDTTGKNLVPTIRNAELHALIVKAFAVFEDWPNRYYEFLKYLQVHAKDVPYDTGLMKHFGQYYFSLYECMKSKQYNFMRDAFEQFLVSGWTGGYVTKKCRRLTNIGYLKTMHVSRGEAARMLKISHPWVSRLIEMGKLSGVVGKMGSRKFCVVDRCSLNDLKASYRGLLTSDQAAKVAGIYANSFVELAREGILEALRGPSIDGYSSWMFKRSAIRNFLNRIRSKCGKRAGTKQGEISFVKAVQKLTRLNVSTIALIKGILSDEIKPSRMVYESGVRGLKFSSDKLADYMKAKLASQRKGSLSVTEAAYILGIKEMVAYFFVIKGYLLAEKMTVKKRSFWCISFESIDIFKSTYVTLSQLVKSVGVCSKQLKEKLKTLNVLPVSGPNVDGGRQYLYKKEDLNRVNILGIASDVKIERKNKLLKEARTFTLATLAKFLRWSSVDVRKRVDKGELKPYYPSICSRGKGSRLLFNVSEIERFIESHPKETGLISAKDAAEMLKIDLSKFYKRLVKKGKLKPMTLHMRYMKYYFRTTAVKKMQDSRKAAIGVPAAAALLGIDGNTILKYKYNGLITPVSGPGVDDNGHYSFLPADIERLRSRVEAAKNNLPLNSSSQNVPCVTAHVAEKMLGLCRTRILKLTRLGILKAISGPDIDGFWRYLYLKQDVENLCEKRKEVANVRRVE